MYNKWHDFVLQDAMAESNPMLFHPQVYYFIPLQPSPVAYFFIQTCMPQLSIIQAYGDTPESLRVHFIDGAHLQLVTVCHSHITHLLYLSLVVFYANCKWRKRAGGTYGWLFFSTYPSSFLIESFFKYKGNTRTLIVFCHTWQSSIPHFVFWLVDSSKFWLKFP